MYTTTMEVHYNVPDGELCACPDDQEVRVGELVRIDRHPVHVVLHGLHTTTHVSSLVSVINYLLSDWSAYLDRMARRKAAC